MYLFLNSELQLGKSKEFNNQGTKVQVKRAFKSFFPPKPPQKNRQTLHEFSSTTSVSMHRCLNPPFQNQCPLFCCLSFFNISTLRSESTKWSRNILLINTLVLLVLTWRIRPLKLLWTRWGFFSLQSICWIFYQMCIFNPCWGEFSNLWCSDS